MTPSTASGQLSAAGGRRGKRAARRVAVLATCLAMLLGGALAVRYERTRGLGRIAVDPSVTPFWGPAGVNAFLLQDLTTYDSRGQSLGHRAAMLAVALLTLVAPWLRPLRASFARRDVGSAVAGLAALTGLAFYGVCMRCGHRPWLTRSTAAAALATLGLVAAARRLGRARAGAAIVLAIVLASNLPGVAATLDLSDPSGKGRVMLIGFQQHFATVFGTVDRFAAGERLVSDVAPGYGLLLHLALAAYERHVAPLAMGDLIRCFQLIQLAYLALSAWLFWSFSRGRWWACLLGLLLVLPWYSFNHQAVLMPNQSAWRTIGFPVALLAIRAVHRSGLSAAAFALGAVGGLVFLENPESGIPGGVGLAAYLFLRARAAGAGWRPLGWLPLAAFPLGVVACWAAFAALWRGLLGSWPDPLALEQIREGLAFSSSISIGGQAFPGDLLPVALFAWSSAALLSIALEPPGRFAQANGLRACVAVTSLVWLSYYANRPAYWNLSSFCVLFGFPAIDAARILVAGSRRRGGIRPFDVAWAFLLTWLVTVPTLLKNADQYRMYRMPCVSRVALGADSTRHAAASDRALLSGVLVDGPLARRIGAKARAIADAAHSGPVVFLSMDSYLIAKASGVNSVVPKGGLLFDAWTERSYDRLLEAIRRAGAAAIYVDPLDPLVDDPGYYFARFYRKVLDDLRPSYRLDRRDRGWEVWVPREGVGPEHRGGSGERVRRPSAAR